MDQQEMLDKIEKVKNGNSNSEIFDKKRPPEEFGDAVELFYDKAEDHFKAVVFDPELKIVYSEKQFAHERDVCAFILSTVK